ncbi:MULTISPECIES: hypothetical protein [Haloferax]|uniref:Lipoprotein n=1 Tax=Haloferax marinum TaxID=2666143 RepID=A0A6A8GD27_9EURY|nr:MULTISPECIES: hypothetical protein [Haloferax]KAB1191184.1 hypothetical protein Hfx1150_16020 [Haloferax sp. CBA1150]MRW98073.1 hypothetical protein [Haloferax marinum]
MHRRQFLGGAGVGIVLIAGCLGGSSDTTTPDAGSQQSGGNEQTPKPQTKTPEPTPESTPEPTPDPSDDEDVVDRIDFTREEDDPDVVGTLLTKGPVPGVVVSSDIFSAKAWQNYATVDEEDGVYKIGLSVSATSAIGRLSVVGKMYDEAGELLSEDSDVSNNIPSGEKALIHLGFDGNVDEMYHFEVSLFAPK